LVAFILSTQTRRIGSCKRYGMMEWLVVGRGLSASLENEEERFFDE
jgi:hypothetical protein